MNAPRRHDVHLLPGDICFGGRDLVIRTVLGSCVAITLWHPQHFVGGMCHYLLPTRRDNAHEPLSGRYCDEALLLLLREVLRHGFPLAQYHIKCFGGASVLSVVESNSSSANVAVANIESLRINLRNLGWIIKAEDLGGTRPRTIELHLANGDVLMRTGAAAPDHSPAGTSRTRKVR